ncbi:hypothetical protein CC78DRAFT_581980 [Lojkania enalia]|uniref:Uncharacterized protein n=1 Tax=Lojkania enalia TaxID=147567 RepID=A0A9P4K5F2_9PLEO|nr:hypothetical protein CC78DRAFT_581980 [Didymosphaeria enalia]
MSSAQTEDAVYADVYSYLGMKEYGFWAWISPVVVGCMAALGRAGAMSLQLGLGERFEFGWDIEMVDGAVSSTLPITHITSPSHHRITLSHRQLTASQQSVDQISWLTHQLHSV